MAKCVIHGDVNTRAVTIDGMEIDPAISLSVCNHSPDGFNWGYGGSGPAQLAFAILIDQQADLRVAFDLHQVFKWELLVSADGDKDLHVEVDVNEWVEKQKRDLEIRS